jgi:hypothetical protein
LIVIEFTFEVCRSIVKLLIVSFQSTGRLGLNDIVTNALALSVVFATWHVGEGNRVKDWFVNFFLTELFVIAQTTSDG